MAIQSTLNYKPEEPEKKPRQNTGPHPDPLEAAVQEGEIAPAETATGSDLVVIDPKDTALITAFSAEKGLDPLIERIKKRVKSEPIDVTTEEGRARIGSIARDIGKSKMSLKRMAADLTEDWRTKTKAVTSETTRMEKELDTLRDDVLAPRVEFENRERLRVDGHKTNLDQIAGLSSFPDPDYPPTSAAVQARIDRLADFKDLDWQEFTEVAKTAKEKASAQLADMLVRIKKAEDDAAELARLRAEQEAREKKDREDKIAAEAAAKAKKDAEELAEKQRLDREAETKREQEAAQKIIDDQKAALVKAEADKKAAAEKAEADRVAAAAKAARDVEAAAKAERDRIAAEQEAERKAAADREANTKHKAKINNEALAVVQGIMDELFEQGKATPEIAKTIIIWIAEGKVPAVTIKY